MVLTKGGYIKRTDKDSYKSQKRGGVGVIDMDTKDEDFVNIFLTANTHDDILFFTDKGKAYKIKMYDLPEGKKATKGKSIVNFLSLAGDERVTSVLSFSKKAKEDKATLFMVTKHGVIKKVEAESFADVRKSGIVAIKLGKGDELENACLVHKGDNVIIATKKGQSIFFKEANVRTMGRAAGGVRGIKMPEDDEVVGAGVVGTKTEDTYLLTMSKNGFGKKTLIKQYRLQQRGGTGIKTSKVTPKTGPLMIASVVTSEVDEIIAISQKGQVIRTSLDEIPSLGRQTQGVKIMRVKAGDSIATMTCF